MPKDKHQKHTNNDKNLVLVTLLIALVALIEFIGGILSKSLALFGDAGHMLTDAFALSLSAIALHVALKPSSAKKTFGYRRIEILAALMNGVILFGVAAYIVYEALIRFSNPQPVKTDLMVGVAVLGLAANLVAIMLLKEKSKQNLNVKSAFLHIVGDTISSFGVIGGGIAIYFTGVYLIDPIIGLLIGGVIIRSAYDLVKEASDVLLEAVPAEIKLHEVINATKSVKGVKDVHDAHIWAITSGVYALSAHILIDDQMVSKGCIIIKKIESILREKFDITHTTLQVECLKCGSGFVCGVT